MTQSYGSKIFSNAKSSITNHDSFDSNSLGERNFKNRNEKINKSSDLTTPQLTKTKYNSKKSSFDLETDLRDSSSLIDETQLSSASDEHFLALIQEKKNIHFLKMQIISLQEQISKERTEFNSQLSNYVFQIEKIMNQKRKLMRLFDELVELLDLEPNATSNQIIDLVRKLKSSKVTKKCENKKTEQSGESYEEQIHTRDLAIQDLYKKIKKLQDEKKILQKQKISQQNEYQRIKNQIQFQNDLLSNFLIDPMNSKFNNQEICQQKQTIDILQQNTEIISKLLSYINSKNKETNNHITSRPTTPQNSQLFFKNEIDEHQNKSAEKHFPHSKSDNEYFKKEKDEVQRNDFKLLSEENKKFCSNVTYDINCDQIWLNQTQQLLSLERELQNTNQTYGIKSKNVNEMSNYFHSQDLNVELIQSTLI